MSEDKNDSAEKPAKANFGLLVLFWGFVGVPLAWGFYQTVRQALKLLE
jgi:hypothetical protein